MTSTISSGLYHIETRDFDYEIVHLYEHMLIQTFIDSLPEHDISQFFFGWLSGETFRDFMFVNYNFYNPAAEALFHQFMQGESRINFSLLDNELLRIQAEDLSVIKGIESDALIAELQRIDAATPHNHLDEVTSEYVGSSNVVPSQIIKLRKSKSKFRRIAVVCHASSLTLDEKVAFQRLAPIIYDMLDSALFGIGLYKNSSGPPVDRAADNSLTLMASYTARRGSVAMKQLYDILHLYVERLIDDIERYPEQLDLYINGFEGSTEWSDAPQSFYRHSGLLTSRINIVRAFAKQNILSILSKMDIKCRAATRDDRRII